MKKTRFLAGLLCVMMVLTMVPMMAMAAPTAAELNAAGQALGKASIVPYPEYTLDFIGAGEDFVQPEYVRTANSSTYTTDGLKLSDGTGYYRYDATNNKWQPFDTDSGNGRFIYAKAKVAEGETLQFRAARGSDKHYIASFFITSTGINVQAADDTLVMNIENFVPGTDWVEYIVEYDSANNGAQKIYVKGGSASSWVLLSTIPTLQSWTTANNGLTGILWSGSGTVAYTAIVKTSTTAAADPVYYDSLEEILGVENVAISNLNLDFTTGYTPNEEVIVSPGSVEYLENGMTFPVGTTSTWYYTPGTDYTSLTGPKGTSTSPLAVGKVGIVKVKLDSESDSINIQFNNPNTTAGRMFADVTASNITMYGGDSADKTNNVSYSTGWGIGTGWTEIMFVPGTASYKILIKNDTTNGQWRLAGESGGTTGYRQGRTYGMGFSTTANTGVYVESFVVYRGAGPQYNSLAEIAGKSPVAEYNFEFDETFETYGFNDGSADVGFVNASGATFTANGMDMTASSSLGYFRAHKSWTPMYNEYQKTAFAFKAKLVSGGALNIQANAGDVSGRVYIDINNTGVGLTSATGVVNYGYEPGTQWVDYFVMRKDGGYAVYAKGEADSKWEMAVYCTGYRSSSATGLQFSGTGGYIKNFRVYNVVDGVAEASTLPGGATELLYGEEFAAAPAYANAKLTGASYADENLVLTTTAEAEANLSLWNVAIPAGGYADIRVKSNANQDITFYDGEASLQLVLKKTYGGVYGATNASAWIADDSNSYRIWRVAKNDDKTYNVYTKAACDDAWLTVGTDIAGKASANSAVIAIKQGANINGSGNGVGSIDYIKVYGSAPADILTLTDGYGTVAVSDGATLSYPQDLYAKVKQDTAAKVILFAEYDEETGILTNVVREVVPAGSGVVSVPYSIVGKKVKVFLWDDATHANLLDVTNLTAKK